VYLGIEIGGTKLQLGIGPGDGTLAGLWRATVNVAEGPEGIRRQIMAGVPELLARTGLDRSQVKSVGIGFGGPVDDATHTIIKSHQIEGWDDFPLADWIEDMLGWPAVLGNDADVAGLAEALFGAGKGLSPIFYITIGSGIGGGLIIDGEIYRGCGRGAAEIGHLGVVREVTQRNVLVFGRVIDQMTSRRLIPLEQVASGWAIGERAQAAMELDGAHESDLFRLVEGKVEQLTCKEVALAAQKGDRFAESILDDVVSYLAEGICQMITLLCPRRIIIGGGVSLLGEQQLFEPLRELVAAWIFKPFAGCYDIVPAALGEEVVVHGALALARRHGAIMKAAPSGEP
jgi:glucokinase